MVNIIRKICLECKNDATNTYKYWQAEIDADNYYLTVTWGRIGTRGQSKTHQCNSLTDAHDKLSQLIRAKLAKGYEELVQQNPIPKNEKSINTGRTKTIELSQINAALLLIEAMRPYVKNGNFTKSSYAQMLNDFDELAPFLNIKLDPCSAFRDIESLEQAKEKLLLLQNYTQ
ncbi:MAG TPA: WGR domain-containing protein [Oculatellaceae cyanobacterium]|jgi:predicted DNA-binding WGR domain protein